MKYAPLLPVLLCLGCASKKPVSPKVGIPVKCIVGAEVGKTECKQITNEEALCNGVAIKFECVKVVKP